MSARAMFAFGWVLGLVLCLVPAAGAAVSGKDEAQELCGKFLQGVIAGDVEGAFAVVTPHMPLPESEINALQQLITEQLALIGPRFGKVIGYEPVKEENVDNLILRYTFVQKFERHVLRWVFTFYRPQGSWDLNGLLFDDDMGALFR